MSELPSFITANGTDYTMTLSASGAETFDLCEAKFAWSRVTGIEAATPHAGANYGKGVHVGLASIYTGADFAAAESAVLAHFEANPQPATDYKGRPEWRNAARALQALNAYRASHELDDFKVLGVEQQFTVQLGTFKDATGYTIDVYLRGIRDLDVLWSGREWVVDHKTSKEYGELVIDKAKISWQFMSYTWAKRQMGRDCAGVIGNFIIGRPPFFSENRKPKASDLPRDQFERHEFAFSDDELAEWHKDAMETAQRIWTAVRSDSFHRERGACAHWGKCEYYRLCWETNESMRLAAALGADFRPRTPSPFELEDDE